MVNDILEGRRVNYCNLAHIWGGEGGVVFSELRQKIKVFYMLSVTFLQYS